MLCDPKTLETQQEWQNTLTPGAKAFMLILTA